jgi:hypothetical protein
MECPKTEPKLHLDKSGTSGDCETNYCGKVGMTLTIHLSDKGKTIIQQARQQRDWKVDDDRWLRAATEKARPEPTEGWCDYWQQNPDGFEPTAATLKRFLRQRNIRQRFFVALCEAIAVDWRNVVDWKRTIDRPSIASDGTLPDFLGGIVPFKTSAPN